jgi:protein-disulfide isomerase
MKLTKHLTLGISVVSIAIVVACTANSQAAKAKPNFVTKEAPRPGVVAKIAGEEITEEQLIGEDKLDFFELEKRNYELRMDKLNKLVQERLIGAEAKKANMPTEEYINKKIVGGDTKISEKDFNAFVKEKHIPESQLNPQIKERIESYLKSQKRDEAIKGYLAKLTKSNPVEVYFTKPKMAVNVELGSAPTFGGDNAKVTIVEFSDFQCPFCSRAAETVNQLKKKYGNKIKLGFRHFPLPNHPQARPASEASMCIHSIKADKFWPYHDLLFKNQDKLDAANLEKYAKDVGVDVAKWKECFDGKKFAAVVQQDSEYGEKIGVRSTPTFFINGQIVSGALPIENFSEIIDEELEAKK